MNRALRLVFAAILIFASAGCPDDGPDVADGGGAPTDGSTPDGANHDKGGVADKNKATDTKKTPDKKTVPDKKAAPDKKQTIPPPPKPAWIAQGKSPSWAGGDAIAVDSAGNVIVAGSFDTSIQFGKQTLSSGRIFIVKLDPKGNLLWLRTGGGKSGDCKGVSVDASKNIYITGTLAGAGSFGSFQIPGSGYTNKTYVTKLSPGGKYLWAKGTTGTKNNNGHGIATDAAGNSVIVGRFISKVTFGSHTVSNSQIVDYELFVAKINSSGKFLWGTHGSGTVSNGLGVAQDAKGNAFVTGEFKWPMKLGGTYLPASGATNVFIARLNKAGSFTWAAAGGGTGKLAWSTGHAVDVDGAGNVYATGTYNPSITFGGKTQKSQGTWDAFVVKYTSAGAVAWVTGGGSTDADYGYDLVASPSGPIYLLTTVGGSPAFGGYAVKGHGGLDVAVVGLTPGGAFSSVTLAGGSSSDRGYGITRNSAGHLFVTGEFYKTATFGSKAITVMTKSDAFVWSLTP